MLWAGDGASLLPGVPCSAFPSLVPAGFVPRAAASTSMAGLTQRVQADGCCWSLCGVSSEGTPGSVGPSLLCSWPRAGAEAVEKGKIEFFSSSLLTCRKGRKGENRPAAAPAPGEGAGTGLVTAQISPAEHPSLLSSLLLTRSTEVCSVLPELCPMWGHSSLNTFCPKASSAWVPEGPQSLCIQLGCMEICVSIAPPFPSTLLLLDLGITFSFAIEKWTKLI